MSRPISLIESSHWTVPMVDAIIQWLGHYMGLDWSLARLQNGDSREAYLLEHIVEFLVSQSKLLDQLREYSTDPHHIEEYLAQRGNNNPDDARCMGMLRKYVCNLLLKLDYAIPSQLGQLNSLLNQFNQLLEVRGEHVTDLLREEFLASRISEEEKKVAEKLEKMLHQLGWQTLPWAEREEMALALSHYFYSSRQLEAASHYLVSAIAAGVRTATIYYNYFMLGLEAREFEAALEGYAMLISMMPELAMVSPNHYKLQQVVAKNRYYIKFTAMDLTSNRNVIIQQWLNPPYLLRPAIQAILKIQHEGIITAYEWIESNPQRPVLVTESLEWLTLPEFFCNNMRLASTPALIVMSNLLQTMSFSHEQGMIHGHLQPDVIFIKSAKIKIENFGLWAWQDGWPLPLQKSELLYAHFTAPELYINPTAAPTTASDVYSLGQLLSYIWTGSLVFHTAEKRIPDLILSIVQKATSVDPAQRYASAKEMNHDFQKATEVISQSKESTTVVLPLSDVLKPKAEAKTVASERMVKIAGSNNPVMLPERFVWRDGVVHCQSDNSMMVVVPYGFFIMGSSEFELESPVHEVFLSNFLMDKYLVTNAQYSQFLEYLRQNNNHLGCHPQESPQKDHTPLYWGTDYYRMYSSTADSPVIFIDWWDAYAYANWSGKSLPTESQWEKAARGTDGRHFPWGDTSPDSDHANHNNEYGAVSPVSKFAQFPSPYGCLDMAGNVWEWCLDYYEKNFYSQSPRENPLCNTSSLLRVARGGAWNSISYSLRSTARDSWLCDTRAAYIGFRCAKVLSTTTP